MPKFLMTFAFLSGAWSETPGQCCGAQWHRAELPGRGTHQDSFPSKACSPLQHFQPVITPQLCCSPPSAFSSLVAALKGSEGRNFNQHFSVLPFSVLPPSPLCSVLLLSLERAGFPTLNKNCKHLPTDLLPADCRVCGCLFALMHSAYIGLTKLTVYN